MIIGASLALISQKIVEKNFNYRAEKSSTKSWRQQGQTAPNLTIIRALLVSEEKTQSAFFLNVLNSCGCAKSYENTGDAQKAYCELENISLLLLGNSFAGSEFPVLDPIIKEAISNIQNNFEEVDLEQYCRESETEWDQYVASMLDSPLVAYDFMFEQIRKHRFPHIWTLLKQRLTETQIAQASKWYAEIYKLRTKRDLDQTVLL